MTVLVLDTCFGACSSAVISATGHVLASEFQPMATGQAEALMPMIERVLTLSAIAVCELEGIVVTTGPGSFTGARIGVAAAQGLALAAGVPAAGISSLALIAAAACTTHPESSCAIAAMDARGGNVYLEIADAAGANLLPARLLARDAAARAVREVVGGRSPKEAVLCGKGGPALRNAMGAFGRDIAIDASFGGEPAAEAFAPFARRALSEGRPAMPLYLRPPDARPQAMKALARV